MENGNSDISQMERLMLGLPATAPCGATIYPVRMRQYEQFQVCKKAILMRQSTLPVQFAVMPYLTALFALDAEAGFGLGLVQALRILISMVTLQPLENIGILVSAEKQTELRAIVYNDGEKDIRITPRDFAEIRRIISQQNGEDLPDESENPELVQAEMDIAASQQLDVEFNLESMLDSVSFASGKPLKELLDMPIRAFSRLEKAISRNLMFKIFTQASMSGFVKFPKGNPYPSWMFDRKKDGGKAFESMKDFAARTGIDLNTSSENKE